MIHLLRNGDGFNFLHLLVVVGQTVTVSIFETITVPMSVTACIYALDGSFKFTCYFLEKPLLTHCIQESR
jgi:hypothetical protein